MQSMLTVVCVCGRWAKTERWTPSPQQRCRRPSPTPVIQVRREPRNPRLVLQFSVMANRRARRYRRADYVFGRQRRQTAVQPKRRNFAPIARHAIERIGNATMQCRALCATELEQYRHVLFFSRLRFHFSSTTLVQSITMRVDRELTSVPWLRLHSLLHRRDAELSVENARFAFGFSVVVLVLLTNLD